MKRALPRTNFNSSKLIRFLTELSIVDAAESKQTFAERLGEWLDFSDAITLHAAHSAPSSTAHSAKHDAENGRVEEEFARARTALANSIIASCSPEAGEARIKFPTPKPGASPEMAVAYEPFRRFHLAHQGDMELSVRPLRARVRQALANASPRLGQLAALDAALETILGVRERQVLSSLPALLENRFEQLLAAHQERRADSPHADDPGQWMQPGQWLARFCGEVRDVLLAELDLRLQPAAGLIEAFSNEAHK